MKRQYKGDGGFLISYLFNLIFHGEWLAGAVIFFILDLWLGLPSFIWGIFLGIFFIWPLIITLFLSGISSTVNNEKTITVNKNPYSKKNSDININNDTNDS